MEAKHAELVGSSSPVVVQLLLTGRQAAQAVNLCEKSLYLAVRRGELRAIKIGRSVRYRLQDLEAWIATKQRCQEADRV